MIDRFDRSPRSSWRARDPRAPPRHHHASVGVRAILARFVVVDKMRVLAWVRPQTVPGSRGVEVGGPPGAHSTPRVKSPKRERRTTRSTRCSPLISGVGSSSHAHLFFDVNLYLNLLVDGFCAAILNITIFPFAPETLIVLDCFLFPFSDALALKKTVFL